MEIPDKHKLIGIILDATISFCLHLHNFAVRVNYRIGFLRKESGILDQTGLLPRNALAVSSSQANGHIRNLPVYASLH